MSRLHLRGCRPEPLASYLKALGVLRLVASQRDPSARGWWDNDVFVIESECDRAELIHFFLHDYSPTPIVAPWNGGSGFYEGDTVTGRDAILADNSPRFEAYRSTIREILSWEEMPGSGLSLGQLTEKLQRAADSARGKKLSDYQSLLESVNRELDRFPEQRERLLAAAPEVAPSLIPGGKSASSSLVNAAKKLRTNVNQLSRSAGKETLIELCRARLSEQALEWIDAVVLMTAEGEAEYPPLLGTGGNDGRFDYTNNQMQRLSELLLPQPQVSAEGMLASALFGDAVDGLRPVASGQYDPGRAGGPNQGCGISGSTPYNSWDYILGFEGTPIWASSIVRRSDTGPGLLSSSFTVRPVSAGYGSSVAAEQARAEVWAPLWDNPLGLSELRAFFAEGRAEIGGKRAQDSLQFAEAVRSLGVDRGVREFVRYSMLERRGKSYIALPAGRFYVEHGLSGDFAREVQSRILPIDSWMRVAYKEAPVSLVSARRAVDIQLMELLARSENDSMTAQRYLAVFESIGVLEREIHRRSNRPKLPPGGISCKWLSQLPANSLEVRLAASLASVRGGPNSGVLRCHWAPIDPGSPWKYTEPGGRQCWEGPSLAARMAAALRRRILDAQRPEERQSNTHFLKSYVQASLDEAVAFLTCATDDKLLENLLFAFSWLKWDDVTSAVQGWTGRTVSVSYLPREFCLLKLMFNARGQETRANPNVINLLLADRVREACELTRQRLFSDGRAPIAVPFDASRGQGVRLAATLLIPLRHINFSRKVLNEQQEEGELIHADSDQQPA